MPPFQSRLFNWIYHSPPFQWGRRARYVLQRWFQELPRSVEHFWQDTVPHLFAPSPPPKEFIPLPDRAKLPPWRRFLARVLGRGLSTEERSLTQPSPALIPHGWRALLEEAINYFLRRPKLSPRQQEYENEAGHWPPLPPPGDQITEIKLEPEDPPLYAWIDTHATSLGYAYSPVVNFLLWIDRWVAQLEAWVLKLWRKFWNWLTTYRPA